MTLLTAAGFNGSKRDCSSIIFDQGSVIDALSGFSRVLLQSDFNSFDGTVATNVGKYAADGAGGMRSYEDTGGAITPVETTVGGVIKFTTAATDNNEVWLCNGGAKGAICKISESGHKRVRFEARVSFGQVTAHNWFVGLSEEGLAAANTITDAGALADKDLIGFAVLEADPGNISCVIRKSGQAVVTVLAAAQAITADTFYKLGFVYDPKATKRIRWYVDGVEVASSDSAVIAAATFPDDEELGVLFGGKTGAAADKSMSLDWFRLLADL